MTSHFNFKSLTFYGLAIGSVLLLFNVVTAYGEANLKASAPIDGRYRLTLAQNLPCLKSNALLLTIEQSGVYLQGSLLPAETNGQQLTSAEKKPSLTGQLSNQQLSLSGTVPSLAGCSNPVSQTKATASTKDEPFSFISIASQIKGKNLEGKITLSGIPKQIEFTAQREDPVQPSESTGH